MMNMLLILIGSWLSIVSPVFIRAVKQGSKPLGQKTKTVFVSGYARFVTTDQPIHTVI